MDTLPVTLIVKAPNHAEYQDHTVKCELSWTIRRLKGHLSEVYPCQPEEQKLIYSGQLLQDAVVLKDVLRQYDDGQATHTVHLVYTPKQQQQQQQQMNRSSKDSATSSSSSSSSSSATPGAASNMSSGDSAAVADGLRRRNVVGGSSSSAGDNNISTTANTPSSPTPTPSAGQLPVNLQALYSQPPPPVNEQVAAYHQWYQQQYLQYVNQYMAYMTTIHQQQQQSPWPGMPSFIPLQSNIPPTTNTAAAQPTNAGDPVVGDDAGGNVVVVAPAAQQPRFPLLVHEPDRPERDWLDHVNAFCRITFLLLMIYFYSSALRFCIVMCAIFALFMYRNRRAFVGATDRLPPVPARPVGGEAGAAGGVVEEEGNAEGAPLLPPPGRPDNNNNMVDQANRNNQAATVGQEQNNPPTTVLSFLRTFVTSFLYSLLPEPAMAP